MKKAKALKTLMVSGKVYLADQIIPEIEEEQYWRLYEINAVEVIEDKKKRKRRTKAEMEAAKIQDETLESSPNDQEIELEVEAGDQGTIPVPLEEDVALPPSTLPM